MQTSRIAISRQLLALRSESEALTSAQPLVPPQSDAVPCTIHLEKLSTLDHMTVVGAHIRVSWSDFLPTGGHRQRCPLARLIVWYGGKDDGPTTAAAYVGSTGTVIFDSLSVEEEWKAMIPSVLRTAQYTVSGCHLKCSVGSPSNALWVGLIVDDAADLALDAIIEAVPAIVAKRNEADISQGNVVGTCTPGEVKRKARREKPEPARKPAPKKSKKPKKKVAKKAAAKHKGKRSKAPLGLRSVMSDMKSR